MSLVSGPGTGGRKAPEGHAADGLAVIAHVKYIQSLDTVSPTPPSYPYAPFHVI